MPEELNDLQDDNPTGLRAFAERSAQEATEARRELDDLRRREAFRDAGLDPTNAAHAAMIRGYDGELTEVKSWVDGLGLNQAPAPPPVPDPEREALERIGGIQSGDGGANPNPEADGNARLKTIVDQAVREKWGTQRFNETYTAEMQRQRRPTTTFQDTTLAPGAVPRS